MDLSRYIDLFMDYAPNFVAAIVVLILGLWLIRLFVKAFGHWLHKRDVDLTLQPFLRGLVSVLLKVMLVISVATMVGIATTSFIAVLGAAGLAIGLALQGSLANFAGGILILLFKPYRVGDLVEIQGEFGKVEAIQIFNTIIITMDNKTIFLPNGMVSNGAIKNFSKKGVLRVDMTFGIGYSDDIPKAKKIIMDIITNNEKVLKDPAPMVALAELGDSSVNFTVRPWATVADFWGVYFDTHEKVKEAFDANGISIPFPQRDVHMYKQA